MKLPLSTLEKHDRFLLGPVHALLKSVESGKIHSGCATEDVQRRQESGTRRYEKIDSPK